MLPESSARPGCDRPDRSTQVFSGPATLKPCNSRVVDSTIKDRGAGVDLEELAVERPFEPRRAIDQGEEA